MTFLKVSEVLKSSILRSGDSSSLLALQVFKAFQEVLFELYGKKYTKKALTKIKPKKFAWGTLAIWVPSSIWSQELKLKNFDILEKVNKKLESKVVKKIAVRIKI